MKRRHFIYTLVASLLGFCAFSLVRWFLHAGKDKELAQPKFLSRLCDQNTIRMLGRAYLKLKPDESANKVLLRDILEEKSTPVSQEMEDIIIAESHIEERIKQDFDTYNIVVVQGWVLSITEARQCAFFSIVSK